MLSFLQLAEAEGAASAAERDAAQLKGIGGHLRDALVAHAEASEMKAMSSSAALEAQKLTEEVDSVLSEVNRLTSEVRIFLQFWCFCGLSCGYMCGLRPQPLIKPDFSNARISRAGLLLAVLLNERRFFVATCVGVSTMIR